MTPTAKTSGLIIARLIGGLGNQLFQYAAARRLALKSGLQLKLDVTGFERYSRQKYNLRHFGVVEDLASVEEIRLLRRSRARRLLEGLFGNASGRTHVVERHFHFDPRVLDLRGSVYMQGYWQSEKYFSDIADVIRSELVVRTPPTVENAAALDWIAAINAVCIHVRRGDYVSNKWTNRVHGVCSIEYYRKAVAEMLLRVRDPQFVVFSDDGAWVREHLTLGVPMSFIDHNGPDQNYEDLRLMAGCRHHIIANSTFSWWGAWLGARKDQVVIAPRRWFASAAHATQDLCPDRWLRV